MADAADVDEGNDPDATTDMTFAVALSAASGKTVTVPYTLGGTATAGDDYTDPGTKSVTIAPGQTSADIVIPVKGDGIDEPDETVEVTLGAPTNATVSTAQGAGTASGTIDDDDDTPTVQLVLTPASIAEADDTATTQVKENESRVTARLTGASSQAVTLTVAAAPVQPAVAGDFTLSGTALTIAAGATASTGTVTVAANDNKVDAADKTVTISASATGGNNVGNPPDATLTIRDDDARGVTIAGAPVTVDEADDAQTADVEEHKATYTLELDSQPTGTVTVNLRSADTAIADVTPASLTFTASDWNDPQEVTVTGAADDVDNPGGKRTTEIRHTLSASGTDYATGVTVPNADVTVNDDDGPPTGIALTLSPTTLAESAAATTVTVTATVAGDSTYAVAKTVTVAVGGGSATEGTDYATVPDFTVTVPANGRSESETFSLVPTDDIVDEGNETIEVSGSVSGESTKVTGTHLTLTDDDDPPTGIELEASPGSVAEDTASQLITVTARVTGDTAYDTATTVAVTVGDSDDSAEEGVDYRAVADLSIEIPAGGTSAEENFTLRPLDDTRDEDDEEISLTGASGSLFVTGTHITLTDDDGPPVLSVADASVAEGDSGTATLTFTARLDRASDKPVSVAYADAGTGSATAGVDYRTITAGTLGFAARETSKDVTVTVLGDALDEGTGETVRLELSSLDNASFSGGGMTLEATGTIADDDDAGVDLSTEALDLLPDETASYTIRLTSEPESDVAVTATSGDSAAVLLSGGGTSDAASVTLTFTPENWSSTQDVTVKAVAEGTPEIAHSLTTSAASYQNVTADAVEVEVSDGPFVTISGPGRYPDLPEGATAVITVTADAAPASDLQVWLQVSDDGDADFLDGAEQGERETTLAAGRRRTTLELTIVADDVDEPSGHVFVTLLDGPGYRVAEQEWQRQVWVGVDDDLQPVPADPGPTVAIAGGSAIDEGETARFTLTADEAPDSALALNLVVSQDGRFVPSDALNRQTFSFPAGRTTADYDIRVPDDGDDEPDGAVTVLLAAGDGYRVDASDSASVKVADDDATAVVLSRSGTGAIAEDGGVGEVRVRLGRSLVAGESATVPLEVTGATHGEHYRLTLASSGAGVSLDTSTPHSAQHPAVSFSGAGARSATLRIAAMANSDTTARTLSIDFGTGSRAPSATGMSGGVRAGGGAVEVPIADGDGQVSVTAARTSEGGTLEFEVSLPEPAPAPGVTVGYETLDGRGAGGDAAYRTATAGSDYTAAPSGASIDIARGRRTGTVSVATADDNIYEGDHYLRVRLTSTSQFSVGSANTAVGTIEDAADRPSFAFADTEVEVDEGAGVATLRVERSGTAQAPATVAYATSAGTAASGSDFSPVRGELRFDAGDSVLGFDVPITDDSADEAGRPERFGVSIAVDEHGTLGNASRAEVLIVDNDPTMVRLSVESNVVEEGNGSAELEVSLERSLEDGEVLEVPLILQGSGQLGVDYTLTAPDPWPEGVSYSNLDGVEDAEDAENTPASDDGETAGPPTITFTGGPGMATEAPLTLTALRDTETGEDDESVIVRLGNLGPDAEAAPAGGAAGEGSAHIEIRNVNIFRPTVSVSAPRAEVTEGEDVVLTFRADWPEGAPQDKPLEIYFTLVALGQVWAGESGLDPEGGDLDTLSTSIRLAAGVTEADYVLGTVDDEVAEADGSVATVIANGDGYIQGERSDDDAKVWVRDDDDVRAPLVTVSAGAAVPEGGEAVFTLHADPAPSADIHVDVYVQGVKAEGADQFRLVTIAAGQTGAELRVPARDDDLVGGSPGTIEATLLDGDGYRLDGASSASVRVLDDEPEPAGPPTLSVADAQVDEGPGAELRFTVTLSYAPASRQAAVWYTTRDVTATAGSDYTAVEGKLHFRTGETAKTVSVPVHDDGHDEGAETLEFVLSNATFAEMERAVAVGTIVNDDPMPKAWLARFGRSVAEQVIDGVSGRWQAPRTPDFEGRIGGAAVGSGETGEDGDAPDPETDIPHGTSDHGGLLHDTGLPDENGTMTFRDLLLQSDFTLTGEMGEGEGAFGFWGRASESRFEGAEAGIGFDGEVATGMLGADLARGDWLAGLALTHSVGEGLYTLDQGSGGEVDAALTALAPYGHLRLGDGLSIWGAAGVGQGRLTLKPRDEPPLRTDLGWQMASVGARDELLALPVGGGLGLAANADLLWARTTSDAVAGLAAAEADVTRFRMGLEGTWNLAFEDGGSLTPRLAAGLRHDAGDAETGWGLELGGGLAWQHPARGLDLAIEGRGLATHEDSAFRDFGYSASLAFDPRPDSEHGLSLSLRRDVGETSPDAVESLFSAGPPLGSQGGGAAERRWTAEAAWGLPAFRKRFVGVPFVSRSWSGTGRDTSIGWRLTPGGGRGLELSLDLEATRRESDASPVDHALGLELGIRW